MKLNLYIAIFSCIFLAYGCKKNKQDIANASSINDESSLSDGSNASDPNRTQVATGEMRDLLLTLKRVHFPYNSSTLGPNARQALEDAAEKLRSIDKVALYVDGHTDERGTTEYNMSLSERRAQAVADYLKKAGVERDRLNIVSFGEERPIINGSGPRQFALNRRVEFRLLHGDIQFVLEDGDPVDDNGTPLTSSNQEEESSTEEEGQSEQDF